jgi:hypothetical protein
LLRHHLWLKIHRSRTATLAFAIYYVTSISLLPPNAHAAACSEILSTAVASALRPVIGGIQACKDLKREVNIPFRVTIGVDQTDKIELRSLTYCASDTTSHLNATIYVKCRTSDAAAVKLSVDETFDVTMTIGNTDCSVTDFAVSPRGEIGRLVTRLAGFSDDMKEAAMEQIATLCK